MKGTKNAQKLGGSPSLTGSCVVYIFIDQTISDLEGKSH